MSKLGKKARKFVKKNLPALQKRQRKQKALFNKRRTPSRDGHNVVQNQEEDTSTTRRKPVIKDIEDASIDIFLSEEEQEHYESDSDTDGFLSEDSSCLCADGSGTELHLNDAMPGSKLSTQNQIYQSELLEKKKRLEALKKKDPHFVLFLQNRIKEYESLQNDDMSDDDDDDERSNSDHQPMNGNTPSPNTSRLLKSSTVNNWFQMVKEQRKMTALPSLLNAYRAACHYGADSTDADASSDTPIVANKETFCTVLMFMLSEGDQLLRSLLGISSKCKIATILELRSSSKWKNAEPMVKSYLTSTLYLLNQFTDADILAYALTRLRASLIFFAVLPALENKLTEIAVHLWATGSGAVSSCSFLILCDIASCFGHDASERCLRKTHKAILSRCRVVDLASLKHIEFLKKSFVELCSLDLKTSVRVLLASMKKLATVLQLGFQAKDEALRKICSWEYVLCIDVWVMFVSVNNEDNNLHTIVPMIVQVIQGVAKLFAGQRYLPLKVKCIRWLNHLSSSKIFIPVSSLALDILENSNAEEDEKPRKGNVNLSTALKLPKHWLKSREFQEESVFAAIELLCAHFLQWSHHISFPELATIPMIRLKQFHEKSTIEGLRRAVQRLTDQVENNIDFVQINREGVSFSPKDQDTADTIIQIERPADTASYIQYYKSVIQNATKRNTDDQKSTHSEKNNRKRKLPKNTEDASANGAEEAEKSSSSTKPSTTCKQEGKRKKQKVKAC